jgi:DNA repair protein RadC
MSSEIYTPARLGPFVDRWTTRRRKKRKQPLPPAPTSALSTLEAPAGPALDVAADEDAALLERILGCSHEQAARLLAGAGSLVRLARFGVDDLVALTGASRADAERIAAACELGRRGLVQEARPAGPQLGATAIARWFQLRIGGLFVQEIWMAGLDEAGALRGACRVSRCDVHGAGLDAGAAVRKALDMRAKTAILVHNHPSADIAVTPDDLRFTLRVHRAALSAGVRLADSILVGPTSGYASMAEQGVLPGSI